MSFETILLDLILILDQMIKNPTDTPSHVQWHRKRPASSPTSYSFLSFPLCFPQLFVLNSLFQRNFWKKITKMGGQDSFGPSLADQWDHSNQDDQSSPLNCSKNNKNNNGNNDKSGKSSTKKYSKKFSQSFNKAMEAASNGMDKSKESVSAGMKKVKDGASWFNQLFRSNSRHTKVWSVCNLSRDKSL